MKNKKSKSKSTLSPQLTNKLSRQQTLALLNVPNVSPGTWLTTPCLSVLNRFNHHFIAIHPLLYCGYNGKEINMVNIWGDIAQGQAKKYITKTWKIVREPKSPQHAALIITRAISRLGEKQYKGLTNNCEHYATWCFTGYSTSRQVHESVVNGFSSGGAAVAGAAIGGLSVPTVAVIGSTEIGASGVVLGIAAATATWPFVLVGALVGSGVGYLIPKCMEIYRKRKYRKKLTEKMYKRQNNYSLNMMDEVKQIKDEINDIVNDDDIDKNDLEILSIALDDVFKILDPHFYRDDNQFNGTDDIDDVDDDEKIDLLDKREQEPIKKKQIE